MTDNEALIAKARADASDIRDMEHESYHWVAGLIETLAEALEALTAEMHSRELHHFETEKLLVDAGIDPDASSSSAPAVDREALAKILFAEQFDGESWEARDIWDGDATLRLAWVSYADSVMTALGARDVRDVQAEALSGAALNIVAGAGLIPPPNGRHPAEAWLHDSAQAIREACNEH